jgi:hypothetical protein
MNIYTLEVFIIAGPVDAKFVKKNPVMSRTLEIRGDQTLAQLHKIIFKAFDRFDEHLYEFQVGGKGPHDPKAKKYGVPAQEDEIFDELQMTGSAEQTTLDDLKLKKDKVFGYWFDFGDDWWHQINVVAIEEKTPKGRYPKITNRVGQSPPQYMDVDE